jgi:hypothetical protein
MAVGLHVVCRRHSLMGFLVLEIPRRAENDTMLALDIKLLK